MSIPTIILYSLATVLLFISLIKDTKKTKMGIKKGWMAFKKIVPVLIPLFMIVGGVLVLVTPEMIQSVLGADSGVFGIFFATLLGSVTFMPPFVSYPLGAELLENGAGAAQVAGFVAALMAVGFVYIPVEIKYFSKKSTILRNVLGLVASLIVAFVVLGVIR